MAIRVDVNLKIERILNGYPFQHIKKNYSKCDGKMGVGKERERTTSIYLYWCKALMDHAGPCLCKYQCYQDCSG